MYLVYFIIFDNCNKLYIHILCVGWAIMTLNPGGLVIFLISFANLVPRAVRTHHWYKEKFDDYPKNRKALIPFVY